MAINFPDAPTVGQQHTVGLTTWIWDGVSWNTGTASVPPVSSFDAGTKLVAAQTTAPTGWTKDLTHNDKVTRVVSGTVGSGGTTAFSTVFASRTPAGSISSDSLSIAQLAAHAHSLDRYSATQAAVGVGMPGNAFHSTINTSSQGSGSTHSHTFTGSAMDFAVQYVDVTIITKD